MMTSQLREPADLVLGVNNEDIEQLNAAINPAERDGTVDQLQVNNVQASSTVRGDLQVLNIDRAERTEEPEGLYLVKDGDGTTDLE